jgi:hypothetical protein
MAARVRADLVASLRDGEREVLAEATTAAGEEHALHWRGS